MASSRGILNIQSLNELTPEKHVSYEYSIMVTTPSGNMKSDGDETV